MSLVTIILGAGAALILAAQLALAVWYRRRFGSILRPSARLKFGGDIPPDQVVILSMFVLGLLLGVAAPVFWPDGAFARWLREPYALVVYSVWCYVGMLVLGIARALAIELRKRRVK